MNLGGSVSSTAPAVYATHSHLNCAGREGSARNLLRGIPYPYQISYILVERLIFLPPFFVNHTPFFFLPPLYISSFFLTRGPGRRKTAGDSFDVEIRLDGLEAASHAGQSVPSRNPNPPISVSSFLSTAPIISETQSRFGARVFENHNPPSFLPCPFFFLLWILGFWTDYVERIRIRLLLLLVRWDFVWNRNVGLLMGFRLLQCEFELCFDRNRLQDRD